MHLALIASIALAGAAIGDFCVESISNTGVFGAAFFDDDQRNVYPTLIFGVALGLLVLGASLVVACRRARRPLSATKSEQIIDDAVRMLLRTPARALPALYVFQTLIVFVMESVEQLSDDGRLAGGCVWLGGPPAFSLLFHACVAAMCLTVVVHSMRAVLRAVGLLVRCVTSALVIRWSWPSQSFSSRGIIAVSLPQLSHIRELGGRAPPIIRAIA